MRPALLSVAAAALLAGCSLLEVDRLDVQQGNRLEPQEIAALEIGMNRTEVAELLGRPVLETTFHADRWEYVYYSTEAGSEPASRPRRLTVYFTEGTVSRIDDRFGSDD